MLDLSLLESSGQHKPPALLAHLGDRHGDMMSCTHFFPGHLREVRDQVKGGNLRPAEGEFLVMSGFMQRLLRTVGMSKPYQWGHKLFSLLSVQAKPKDKFQN